MPVVFRWNGYRFHFFSNEGDPLEPIHIHVNKGADAAKFWLHPEVSLAYNYGFKARELSQLAAAVEANRAAIEEAWHDHFG
jgi:hypothetical protein